jgi:hypothetical protein
MTLKMGVARAAVMVAMVPVQDVPARRVWPARQLAELTFKLRAVYTDVGSLQPAT